MENLHKSNKINLQVLLNICRYDQSSNTGQNISYLMRCHELIKLEQLMKNKFYITNKRIHPLEEGEEWKMALIEELSMRKLGFLDIEMDKKDINRMLQELTVNSVI